MKNMIVHVDFIRNIKSLMTEFLSKKSAKSLSPWLWQEAAKGSANTPRSLETFHNFLFWNIDLVVTESESIIPQDKYISFLTKLAGICRRHGQVNMAADLYERVIQLGKSVSGVEKELGDAKVGLAVILSNQAKFSESKNMLNKAASHYDSTQNKAGLAEYENILGTIEGEKGNLKSALEHLERAMEYVKGSGSSLIKAKISTNLGIIHDMSGNYIEAVRFYTQASTIYKELKLSKRYIELKHNIGMLKLKNERYNAALKDFLACIDVSESEQYQPILGIANAGASEAYFRLGNMKMAELHISKAKSLSRKSNDRLTIADLYRVQGMIEMQKKNNTVAELLFETSIRINDQLDNKINACEVRVELGKIYFDKKRKKEARAELGTALQYYKKINHQSKVNEINAMLKQMGI